MKTCRNCKWKRIIYDYNQRGYMCVYNRIYLYDNKKCSHYIKCNKNN